MERRERRDKRKDGGLIPPDATPTPVFANGRELTPEQIQELKKLEATLAGNPQLLALLKTEVLGMRSSQSGWTALMKLFPEGSFGQNANGQTNIPNLPEKRLQSYWYTQEQPPGSKGFQSLLHRSLAYSEGLLQTSPLPDAAALMAAAKTFGIYYQRRMDSFVFVGKDEQRLRQAPISSLLVLAVQFIKSIPASVDGTAYLNFNFSGLGPESLGLRKNPNEAANKYIYRAATQLMHQALEVVQQQVEATTNLEVATQIVAQVVNYIMTQALDPETPNAIREQLLLVGMGLMGQGFNSDHRHPGLAAGALKKIYLQNSVENKSQDWDINTGKRLKERYWAVLLEQLYQLILVDHPLYGLSKNGSKAQPVQAIELSQVLKNYQKSFPELFGILNLSQEKIQQLQNQLMDVQQQEAHLNTQVRQNLIKLLAEVVVVPGSSQQFAEILLQLLHRRSVLLALKTEPEVLAGTVSWIRELPDQLKNDALKITLEVLLETNPAGAKLFMDVVSGRVGSLKEMADTARKTASLDQPGQLIPYNTMTGMLPQSAQPWMAMSNQGGLPQAFDARVGSSRSYVQRLAGAYQRHTLDHPIFVLCSKKALEPAEAQYNLPLCLTQKSGLENTAGKIPTAFSQETRKIGHAAESAPTPEIRRVVLQKYLEAIGLIVRHVENNSQRAERQVLLTELAALLVNPRLGTDPQILKDQGILESRLWREALQTQVIPLFIREMIRELKTSAQELTEFGSVFEIIELFGPSFSPAIANAFFRQFVEAVNYTESQLATDGRWRRLALALGLKNPAIHLKQVKDKPGVLGRSAILELAIEHSQQLVASYRTRTGVAGWENGIVRELLAAILSTETKVNQSPAQAQLGEIKDLTSTQITKLKKTLVGQVLGLFAMANEGDDSKQWRQDLIATIVDTVVLELALPIKNTYQDLTEKLRAGAKNLTQQETELTIIRGQLKSLLTGEAGLLAKINQTSQEIADHVLNSPAARAAGITDEADVDQAKAAASIRNQLLEFIQAVAEKTQVKGATILGVQADDATVAAMLPALEAVFSLANSAAQAGQAQQIKQQTAVQLLGGGAQAQHQALENYLAQASQRSGAGFDQATALQLAQGLTQMMGPFLRVGLLRADMLEAIRLLGQIQYFSNEKSRLEATQAELQRALNLLISGVSIQGHSLLADVNAALMALAPNDIPPITSEMVSAKTLSKAADK